MSHDNEIGLLRRELADLCERVTKLEAGPIATFPATPLTAAAPQMPIFVGTTGGDCGCSIGNICNLMACPRNGVRYGR